jgi:Mrp family chromosome partitioning ATPase
MTAINHGLQLDLAMNEVIWSGMRGHPKLHQLLRDVHDVSPLRDSTEL